MYKIGFHRLGYIIVWKQMKDAYRELKGILGITGSIK